MHPDQRTLKRHDGKRAQNRDYHNLTGGIVVVHRGFNFVPNALRANHVSILAPAIERLIHHVINLMRSLHPAQ